MSNEEHVKRTCRFPKDLYEKIEETANINELSIMQVIIQTLRKGLDVPKVKKKVKKENE